IADVVTGAFVHDPFQRQWLLEEAAVSERLRRLIRHLASAQG
ncbi:MAG: hypothetical protein QOD99_2928, partial [Chthoniobacter sp.]|nr:hypothetical protein [Chthoniobacter sp.]